VAFASDGGARYASDGDHREAVHISFITPAPAIPMLPPVRRALVLLALLVAPAPAAAARSVVVIETDDQTVADLAAMPQTRALIGDAGVTFTRSFVSLSECCPSRATFLTGRYAHNHGVLSVGPPFGGFKRLDGAETLPVWLQRAGYATGVVGKYLNGYGRGDPFHVPPGWTDFEALLGPSTYRFYGFTMNVNGVLETEAGYQTDTITERSLAFIRRHAGRPFFLWTTYVAPHVGRPRDLGDPLRVASAVPALRHGTAFLGAPLPRTPSFNERDVSDKPPLIRNRAPIKQWRIRALTEAYRQRLASLLAVDEGVARIVAELRATGRLADTVLIFTSDNGFMTGQHRVPSGKILAYEPSIRVPLLMRGPGIPAGVREHRLVWNGDLAPTILDVAGAQAPFPLDGRSLLAPAPADRTILLEGPPEPHTNGLPRFVGLRTARFKYIEHLWGARELYDLRSDPDETRNLARSPALAGVKARLALRLARLRGCAGARCG
jgi:N-acetylglucosamine-6-sulfatase